MASTSKCLRNQSPLEKILIVFIIILLCIVLFLFISLLSTAYDNEVCNKAECVRASTHILDFVDPQQDPCEDFHKFACGTFMQNAFAKNQPTALHSMNELMLNQQKEIIIAATTRKNLPKSVQQQREFYASCANTTAIDEDGNGRFLELLERVGGWPVLKRYSWNEENFEWSKMMIEAKRQGLLFNFFLNVNIEHCNESNSLYLMISPPKFDPTAWKETGVEAMAEIATVLGAPSVGISTELRRTLHFAEQLKDIIERHNETEPDNLVTIGNMDPRYVKFRWLDFLRNFTSEELTQEDKILFQAQEYLKDLYFLLFKTPKRIQANYMAWKIIQDNIGFLSTSIQEKFRPIDNKNVTRNRLEFCYRKSCELFRFVVEGEYMRRHITEEKRSYITEMITNIKEQFLKIISNNNWLTKESMEAVRGQIRNISNVIGWADFVFDVEKFENFTELNTLYFSSNNIIDMTREIKLNYDNHLFRKIKLNLSESFEDHWFMPVLEVNAYYLPLFNQLILDAPILQGLVFDLHRPHYMNYGALGSIIGHEITHSFINSLHMDMDMYQENSSLLEPTEAYWNRTSCLEEELKYFDDLIDEKNNSTTLEEDVADATGRAVAYLAYQNWVRDHGYEGNLPGVDYTPNQIFWIMSSTYLCSQPDLVKGKPLKQHSSSSYRINMPIRMSLHFGKDFNCPEGTTMNPVKKCEIF